ncbi:hypothetical protein chiPu_0025373 [Chiloscyllium punctatum]|uniref:Uncharacterized protein n=1 Tax=Chiloscyllium punctatum TaxID=137246 RepID=A0A401TEJ0_CHIPU|nr:hypothetical protein [Chiloscyllium punctatum]
MVKMNRAKAGPKAMKVQPKKTATVISSAASPGGAAPIQYPGHDTPLRCWRPGEGVRCCPHTLRGSPPTPTMDLGLASGLSPGLLVPSPETKGNPHTAGLDGEGEGAAVPRLHCSAHITPPRPPSTTARARTHTSREIKPRGEQDKGDAPAHIPHDLVPLLENQLKLPLEQLCTRYAQDCDETLGTC